MRMVPTVLIVSVAVKGANPVTCPNRVNNGTIGKDPFRRRFIFTKNLLHERTKKHHTNK